VGSENPIRTQALRVRWGTNVRGPGTGFVPVLLYTLVIGNLTTPIMNLLAPLHSGFRFPFDWVACCTEAGYSFLVT
jgi:hypothetical protein